MIDEGDTGPELTKLSAMAKLYCTDVAMEVTTDAVQVLGGYGYIQEYPVERMMRDAKITQIYEGTNQIQRLVIAREMVREQRSPLPAGVG
jgi:alkylation response protein AidB-like acyl-CoA dehydrogenase